MTERIGRYSLIDNGISPSVDIHIKTAGSILEYISYFDMHLCIKIVHDLLLLCQIPFVASVFASFYMQCDIHGWCTAPFNLK